MSVKHLEIKIAPFPQVAFCGPKGGGKSWIVDGVMQSYYSAMMMAYDESQILSPYVINFADPIYMIQAVILGGDDTIDLNRARRFNELIKLNGIDDHVEPSVGISPRLLRQKLGGFIRDEFSSDTFVKMLNSRLISKYKKDDHSGIIVTDIRMKNEFDFLKENGFYTIYVNSTEVDTDDVRSERETLELKELCDDQCLSKDYAGEIVEMMRSHYVSYAVDALQRKSLIKPN